MGPALQDPQSSDQRIPCSKTNKVQNEENHPPAHRRSDRIANLKRPAELPSQTAPSKRSRSRAAPKAAASAAQHSTRKTHCTRVEPVQGRPSYREPRGPTVGKKKTPLNKPSAAKTNPADTGQSKAKTRRGRTAGRIVGESSAVTRRLRNRDTK
jgi:hypothetical protein